MGIGATTDGHYIQKNRGVNSPIILFLRFWVNCYVIALAKHNGFIAGIGNRFCIYRETATIDCWWAYSQD